MDRVVRSPRGDVHTWFWADEKAFIDGIGINNREYTRIENPDRVVLLKNYIRAGRERTWSREVKKEKALRYAKASLVEELRKGREG